MWTSVSWKLTDEHLHVNHFVPLVPFTQKPQENCQSIFCEEDFPSLPSKIPKMKPSHHMEDTDLYILEDGTTETVGVEPKQHNLHCNPDQPDSPKFETSHGTYMDYQDTEDILEDRFSEQFEVESHNVTVPIKATAMSESTRTLNGRFMDMNKVFTLLTEQQEDTVLPNVPKGIKQNQYFLIDNSYNVPRRKNKQHSVFVDDCGVWESSSGSTTKTYYLFNKGYLKHVHYRNGMYGLIKSKVFEKIEPQPTANDVVVLCRYYTKLKRDNNLTRRITWIERLPGASPIGNDTAVWEYLGTFPLQQSYHGNGKKNPPQYIRTPTDVKKRVSKAVLTQTPREVYSQCVREDEENAPRDLKQVQNIKQKVSRENKPPGNRTNLADDIQTVLNMLQDDNYVEQVISRKGKPPCVILYLDQQLNDVKRFCCGEEATSVLGVDRTFNLGACFLTLTVFKNQTLVKRDTGEPPIFLGPLYLHWDGSYETYHDFFAHLKSKLSAASISTEINLIDEIAIGSDQEQAILKAIASNFPVASHVLCSRHIKQNVTHYLRDKVGLDAKQRASVEDKIFFSDTALMTAKDSFDFQEKVLDLETYIQVQCPNFMSYFSKNLVPVLKEKVVGPKNNISWLPEGWTNNNCESMNNIIKLTTDWKPQKLPDLILKLKSISELQYLDMRRSLHGQGNYKVRREFTGHEVSQAIWDSKSPEEKEVSFQKFLKAKLPQKTHKTTSRDGHLEIPSVSQLAKKPGQKRSARAQRVTAKRKKTVA